VPLTSTSSSVDMQKSNDRQRPQAPVQAFSPYLDRDSIQLQSYGFMRRQPSNHTDPHGAEYRLAANGNAFGYGDNYGHPTPPTRSRHRNFPYLAIQAMKKLK